jgi:hypothetical protein
MRTRAILLALALGACADQMSLTEIPVPGSAPVTADPIADLADAGIRLPDAPRPTDPACHTPADVGRQCKVIPTTALCSAGTSSTSTCRWMCETTEYEVQCNADILDAGVPASMPPPPPSPRDCKILRLPLPRGTSLYCCPCP